jgi:hypothetical protein
MMAADVVNGEGIMVMHDARDLVALSRLSSSLIWPNEHHVQRMSLAGRQVYNALPP